MLLKDSRPQGRPSLTIGLLLLSGSTLTVAAEQAPTNLSSSFEIQQIQPDSLLRPRPAITPDLTSTQTDAPAQAEQVRFVLQQIQLNGNTVIRTPTLASTWQSLLGQTVSLAQIYQLAADLTARYQQAGYVLSQVIVPVQTIQQGVVRLQVIEGRISDVQLMGTGADHPIAQAYATHIKQQQPLTKQTLERYLLLLNDLGGVDAQPYIQAGNEQGALKLVIQLKPTPIYRQVGIHNRVNPALGDLRMDAAVLTGHQWGFEQHYLGLSSSLSTQVNSLVYQLQQPIGGDGLLASASLSASQVEPELRGKTLSQSESWFASAGLQYPVVRSQQSNLYVYSALDVLINRRDSAFDGKTELDEQIYALNLGARWEWVDAHQGINQIDLSSALGLPILDANQPSDSLLSGAAGRGNPHFFKQNLSLSRVQSLGNTWSLLTALQAQWSKDTLLSSQQMSLGGAQYLRAYDPGELSGERGIAAKLELRAQQTWASTRLTHYGFFDWGEVRMRSLQPSGRLAYREDRAQSVGLGSRFNLPYNLQGYLELAKPIDRKTDHDQSTDARVFGGLSVYF